MNLPPLHEKARLKDDIKAIKTIGITIDAYFLCYVPAIMYAVVGLQKENLADSWFGFIAWYSLYISSALNPIIYYLRARRCRSALKQFLKDPFGSSDFKKNPYGRGYGGNRHNEVMGKYGNSEVVKGGNVWEVEKHGNQTGQKHSKERRNGIVVWSIEDPGADHEVGRVREYKEEKGLKNGKARASNRQVQNSCQEKREQTQQLSTSKKLRLNKKSRKQPPSSTRKKVNSLEVSEMGKTEKPDGEKREVGVPGTESKKQSKESKIRQCSPGNTRNPLSTGGEFERVAKTACTNGEEESRN